MASDRQYPQRKRRSESFLGIHLDFHARDDCDEIGAHTTREMIESIIDQVGPDYLQCDCKGHAGYSSYPTAVGYAAPGIVADALRVWREVTAERGVALYMHYSGVMDRQAIVHHPEWARIDENGDADPSVTSVFGPYVDELLIPQLVELGQEYGVDGVWVDGECWGTHQDYSQAALEAFREKTGIREVPRRPEDPHFFEFTEFCREAFRRYLRHYVDEVHARCPGFEIASNWAYSSFMPDPVEVDVDFISGDYTLQDSVNSARWEGRCMARQGRPWDLMAWSFSKKLGAVPGTPREPANCTKSVQQMMQEAAVVLALGGGFQAYFPQKRDGSVRLWEMGLMREVAAFCRARQAVCHRAKAVPQIGLLYSRAAFYRQNTRLFGPWHGDTIPIRGILQCLLDGQHCVEVLMEHHLSGRLDEYPLIVVPEWGILEPAFREELLAYVRNGGRLLAIGPRAAALFEEALGVTLVDEPAETPRQWLAHDRLLAGLSNTLTQTVELGEGTRAFGQLYSENDDAGPHRVAASVAPYGKGKIAATYVDLGERYLHGASYVVRDFLGALVRELFPDPIVEVTGSHNVDVTANHIDGKLAINLVNTAGPHAHRDTYAFDDIPPVGPLTVAVRLDSPPQHVTLEPGGTNLAYQSTRGKILVLLPQLEIHRAIVIDT